MTLIFAPCFLAKNRVPDFLKVQDPKKISGRPDKLDIRVQIDWATVLLIEKKKSNRIKVRHFITLHFRTLVTILLKKSKVYKSSFL